MGNPSATTAISANAFQHSGTYTYTGSGDVRNTLPSTGGYTGASGGGNVFLTTGGKTFEMSGINTTGYTSLSLSVGHYKSTTTASNELTIEVSTDGVAYTALSYSRPTGTGTAVWLLVTPSGTIPATANLRIRFTNTSSTAMFRVDDLTLSGVAPLGVSLVSFAAKTEERTNLLTWTTESEKNAAYFSIQRAGEDGNFMEVGKLNCFGNSHSAHHYQFSDENPLSGISYYRLQEFDFDGAFQFSENISTQRSAPSGKVFYNNALRAFNFPQDLLQGTCVEIAGISGAAYETVAIPVRTNTAAVDLPATGIYVIRYTTVDGKTNTAKVLIF